MIQRYVFGVLAVGILLVATAVSGLAQTGELRGRVFMQQADGQKVPLGDAQIDVFRTDVTGKYNTKTNKKGEFVFAGLPFVGTYTIAASHPTAAPNFVPGFKVGREVQAEVILTPGEGKRLTLDEIKAVLARSPTAPGPGGEAPSSESAADKAKREELIRKNKEIEDSNKKIGEANATINRTFKTGNEALNAANAAIKANNSADAVLRYTDAINAYSEGLTADGDQPALLTNRALAYKGRGVEKYNGSIRQTDDAARTKLLDEAKADFKAAVESSAKAVTLLKAVPVPTDAAEQQRLNANKYAALSTNAESMRLFVTKSDPTQADAALAVYKEYIALETDPAKKSKAQLDSAQMLLDAGNGQKALAEYQGILTTQPDSPDANLGAGLALYAMGDKTKYQEAANYLQHFVDVAPDTHKFKSSAKEILTELKNAANVTPEKTPTKRKRP